MLRGTWGAAGLPPKQGGRASNPEVKAELCPGTWVSLQGGLPRPPAVPASPCPHPQRTSPPGLLTLAFPFQVEKKMNPSLSAQQTSAVSSHLLRFGNEADIMY